LISCATPPTIDPIDARRSRSMICARIARSSVSTSFSSSTAPLSAAVRSAVPLLKLSSAVTVYEVDDGSVEKPAEEVASYLSRHGIGVEVDRDEVPNGDYVEPLLLSKLESGDFGWAVIGAFSRSRFREALFGGTTKRLLKESPVPLVIAH